MLELRYNRQQESGEWRYCDEKRKIADYSTLPVTKKVYEDIDNATRMKLRNEHLEQQFKRNQSK